MDDRTRVIAPKTQATIIRGLLEEIEAREKELVPLKETDIEDYLRRMAVYVSFRNTLAIYAK